MKKKTKLNNICFVKIHELKKLNSSAQTHAVLSANYSRLYLDIESCTSGARNRQPFDVRFTATGTRNILFSS